MKIQTTDHRGRNKPLCADQILININGTEGILTILFFWHFIWVSFLSSNSPASRSHSRFCPYWEVPNAAFGVREDQHGNSHTKRQSATEVQTPSLYMQGNEAQEKKNVCELPKRLRQPRTTEIQEIIGQVCIFQVSSTQVSSTQVSSHSLYEPVWRNSYILSK